MTRAVRRFSVKFFLLMAAAKKSLKIKISFKTFLVIFYLHFQFPPFADFLAENSRKFDGKVASYQHQRK